jgi:hypothetical protein
MWNFLFAVVFAGAASVASTAEVYVCDDSSIEAIHEVSIEMVDLAGGELPRYVDNVYKKSGELWAKYEGLGSVNYSFNEGSLWSTTYALANGNSLRIFSTMPHIYYIFPSSSSPALNCVKK